MMKFFSLVYKSYPSNDAGGYGVFAREDIRPGVVLPHLNADLVKLSPEYWHKVQSNLNKSNEGRYKNSEILVSTIILTVLAY